MYMIMLFVFSENKTYFYSMNIIFFGYVYRWCCMTGAGARDINSLAPRRFGWNFRQEIYKLILLIDDWYISSGIALRWMSLDFTYD